MMTIEQMRERKRMLGYSYAMLAERAGLPVGTVQKVLGGYSKSPREKTLKKLEEALTSEMQYPFTDESYMACSEGDPGIIAERAWLYGGPVSVDKKRLWTVEECQQLPEEYHVELIDGVIYDQAAPKRIHQTFVAELLAVIKAQISHCGKDCKVYPAPFFVRLEKDNKTFVEPDISVICDRSKLSDDGCEGAPDWIIEIISPATRQRDFGIKLFRYRSAGVKLYWIVDPEEGKVWVYDFAESDNVQIFSLQDRVMVSLCEGFEVDFSALDLS